MLENIPATNMGLKGERKPLNPQLKMILNSAQKLNQSLRLMLKPKQLKKKIT